MARPKSLKPAYCHHKRSGRAFVVLDGKFVYLGEYGTQASRDEYDRVIGEWIACGRRSTPATDPATPVAGLTITSLIHAFWQHAKAYYVHRDGTPTSEQENLRQALRPLRRLYGTTPAAQFGPLALKVVRAEMLKPTTYTDERTGRTTTRPGWARTLPLSTMATSTVIPCEICQYPCEQHQKQHYRGAASSSHYASAEGSIAAARDCRPRLRHRELGTTPDA